MQMFYVFAFSEKVQLQRSNKSLRNNGNTQRAWIMEVALTYFCFIYKEIAIVMTIFEHTTKMLLR